MLYLDFLPELHRQLDPAAYLEIGVDEGNSLALARCLSVGVDPDFHIQAELTPRVSLFRTISDEYFAREDPLAPTQGKPFDLTFIDGMHLFEFALRDFIAAERHSTARGVVILDDVLPRSSDEAARERHTKAWTGDVFRVLEVLRSYRPDLVLVVLDTAPTGLLVVFGLDPTSTVLAAGYDEIIAEYRRADPQSVPVEILDRTCAVLPECMLRSGIFEALGALPAGASPRLVADQITPLVAQRLGPGFTPAASQLRA